jgi:alanyl-tRNA synthetase
MNANEVRKTFLSFFESKNHTIVPSAPMVVKNDPTLMFTNAGMNQFKDIFLGNKPAKYPRVADSQKCLRVSGKHNDLEEVGHDTYHHTMFEMLGNWSFGEYFKKEAISWAWELLTEVYKIDKDRLYVTVFGGDTQDNLSEDTEAYGFWEQLISKDKIIYGSKKDNFWEMGDTGPCGPCSEIHVDIRDDEQRKKIDGKTLVNIGDPHVIEIWNLVFIEFNRVASGNLSPLPAKHVDTGMGFERLCMVLQGKQSNYDTDVFQPIIQEISSMSSIVYGKNEKSDIAMRVVADHLRTIAFAIADGQLPSNNKAGYVIRRILRRAVRYGYTFLGFKEPFIHELLPVLVSSMGSQYPELSAQEQLIRKVIAEEENSFLKTLSTGIVKYEFYKKNLSAIKTIDGKFAFELYDTFGFPIDLTVLIAREDNLHVDMDGFNICMEEQKSRSRKASVIDTDDWILLKDSKGTEFIGYDELESDTEIIKYRRIKSQDKQFYQIVLDKTPFYAESGGQAGDKGILQNDKETIVISDTKKENDLIIHISENLPADVTAKFRAKVDVQKRILSENNHSATHLLHAALKQVLGTHIEQKGSFVDEDRLRFDFAHFSKMSDNEIERVEAIVNEKIRENIVLDEKREVPVEQAKGMGATALFGEKYGETVRVITFDKNYSIELCGGTHVKATGQIGTFRIISENAIAAGIRRIEAITATKAEEFVNEHLAILSEMKELLKNPKDPVKALETLLETNTNLQKQVNEYAKQKAVSLAGELKQICEKINGISLITHKVDLDAAGIKDLAFALKDEVENLFLILANEADGKASLTVMLSDNLVSEKGMNASAIIREIAKEINGGGGGQPFYATAGGKNPAGIKKALERAKEFIK